VRSRKAFTIDLAVHLIGLAEQGRGDIADDQPGIGVVQNIADRYSSRDSVFAAAGNRQRRGRRRLPLLVATQGPNAA
jgi:hypothetical protein